MAHDIIPTLRRPRQENCHKTQAVLSSVESSRRAWNLVWGPISEGKGRTCTVPWHAWWSSTVHSSVNCQVSHPTSSRQSWLSTSEYYTLHLYQPQLRSCQLPSMGLPIHTDSLPDGRSAAMWVPRQTEQLGFVPRSRTSPSTPLSNVF